MCRNESRMHWSGYYCEKCKRLQDTIAIFGDRVYEVVENVLMRNDTQKQTIKISDEIKKEIEDKTYNLRCKKKVKRELEPLTKM